MDNELDLRDLLFIIWRRKILIVTTFLIFVIGAIIYSFIIPPVYQIEGTIELGNFPDKTYTTPVTAKEIISSDNFLLKIMEQTNIPRDQLVELKKNLKVDIIKDSGLIKITLLTKDKSWGRTFIERIIQTFTEQGTISFQNQKSLLTNQMEIMKTRLNILEKDITQTREVLASIENAPGISSVERDLRRSKTLEYLQSEESQRIELIDKIMSLQKEINILKNVEIIQKPWEPDKPVRPRKALNTVIASFLGLMFGVLTTFMVEYFSINPLNIRKFKE